VTQSKRIDIFQEFVAQSAREDMLGFFEFTLDLEDKGTTTGICRLSQPKAGSSSLRYLSLTFVCDTPDEESKRAIDHVLSHLDESRLQAAVPQTTGIVPTPSMHTGPEHHIRQIDILLSSGATPDKRFIAERLLPALQNILPLIIGEVSWWDVRSEDTADLQSERHFQEEIGSSLLERLKNFFRGR
jgi:hypothetical protein